MAPSDARHPETGFGEVEEEEKKKEEKWKTKPCKQRSNFTPAEAERRLKEERVRAAEDRQVQNIKHILMFLEKKCPIYLKFSLIRY